jgi:hypothetical protein
MSTFNPSGHGEILDQETVADLREDRRKWASRSPESYGPYLDFPCLVCGVVEFAAKGSLCDVTQLCVICGAAVERGDEEALLYYALQLEQVADYVDGLSS